MSELGFGDKFRGWRREQGECVKEIVSVLGGGDKIVYLLCAPTGSGKSVIGMSVGRELYAGEKCRVYYVVGTKQLQDQIVDDFECVRKVVGRSNFICQHNEELSCAEGLYCMGGLECPERDRCDYNMQKKWAMEGDFVVMNYSYFLACMNYAKDWSDGDLVVFDECDTMDMELMKFVGVELSGKVFNEYGVAFPLGCFDNSSNKSSKEVVDVEGVLERVRELKRELLYVINENRPVLQMALMTGMGDEDKMVLMSKEGAKAERLLNRVDYLLDNFDEDSWVIGSVSSYNMVLSFKPVIMDKWGGLFFGHGDRFLCMSATTPSLKMFCEEYGINRGVVERKEMGVGFNRERCPIIYRPIGRFSRDYIDDSLELLGDFLGGIVRTNANKKILVHTVNYKISKKLADEDLGFDCNGGYVGVPIFTHDSAGKRSEALESFKFADAPAVLISPSFARGVDLPYDLCEVVVVCKMPYANLGDLQVKRRSEISREWYVNNCINSLVQSCGRAMRSEDDYCKTYIVDECFDYLVKRHKKLFPKWFLDRVCVEV